MNINNIDTFILNEIMIFITIVCLKMLRKKLQSIKMDFNSSL